MARRKPLTRQQLKEQQDRSDERMIRDRLARQNRISIRRDRLRLERLGFIVHVDDGGEPELLPDIRSIYRDGDDKGPAHRFIVDLAAVLEALDEGEASKLIRRNRKLWADWEWLQGLTPARLAELRFSYVRGPGWHRMRFVPLRMKGMTGYGDQQPGLSLKSWDNRHHTARLGRKPWAAMTEADGSPLRVGTFDTGQADDDDALDDGDDTGSTGLRDGFHWENPGKSDTVDRRNLRVCRIPGCDEPIEGLTVERVCEFGGPQVIKHPWSWPTIIPCRCNGCLGVVRRKPGNQPEFCSTRHRMDWANLIRRKAVETPERVEVPQSVPARVIVPGSQVLMLAYGRSRDIVLDDPPPKPLMVNGERVIPRYRRVRQTGLTRVQRIFTTGKPILLLSGKEMFKFGIITKEERKPKKRKVCGTCGKGRR